MKTAILDIETNGLYEEVTEFHCAYVQYFEGNKLVYSEVALNLEELEKIFIKIEKENYYLVVHNINVYDLPVIRKLSNNKINFKGNCFDSLAISYYLYPNNLKHGLEYYGEYYKVPKLLIEDWVNLKKEDYIERCKRDVIINSIAFFNFLQHALLIYDNNLQEVLRLFSYLTFKYECAGEQLENPLHIDIEKVETSLNILLEDFNKRIKEVEENMPRVIKKSINYPKKPLKANGELSKRGEEWLELLQKNNLPLDYKGPIHIYSEPNIYSGVQLKNWLFSLGWQPTMFAYRPSKKGTVNKVPQIQDPNTQKLCPNISLLARQIPSLTHLEGFFMLKHRKEILEGLLQKTNKETKQLPASLNMLTNTLRFTHIKPIVNLPSVNKPYGKEIRGSIISKEGYLCVGADMTALEDTTKQHYISYFDPEYVKEMRVPGYDPHLAIGEFANMLQKEDSEFYKWADKQPRDYPFTEEEKERLHKITFVRKDAKQVNFSAVYGVGASKLSLTTGWEKEKSKKMLELYWEKNKAVKQVAEACSYKLVMDQLWLYNPVSKFYYSLREIKDIFSTLNQGTGVYCFDTWVYHCRKRGIKINMQYHDEIFFYCEEGSEEIIKEKLQAAIEDANKVLNLNVPLSISIKFGKNYAETH